jgi:hypothetical protein
LLAVSVAIAVRPLVREHFFKPINYANIITPSPKYHAFSSNVEVMASDMRWEKFDWRAFGTDKIKANFKKVNKNDVYQGTLFKMGEAALYRLLANGYSTGVIVNSLSLVIAICVFISSFRRANICFRSSDNQIRKFSRCVSISYGFLLFVFITFLCGYGFSRIFNVETQQYIQAADVSGRLVDQTHWMLKFTYFVAVLLVFALSSTLMRPYVSDPNESLPSVNQLRAQFTHGEYCLYAAVAVLVVQMFNLAQVGRYCSYMLWGKTPSIYEENFIACDLSNYGLTFSLVLAFSYLPCVYFFRKWWNIKANAVLDDSKSYQDKQKWLSDKGLSYSHFDTLSLFGPILASALPQLLQVFSGH